MLFVNVCNIVCLHGFAFLLIYFRFANKQTTRAKNRETFYTNKTILLLEKNKCCDLQRIYNEWSYQTVSKLRSFRRKNISRRLILSLNRWVGVYLSIIFCSVLGKISKPIIPRTARLSANNTAGLFSLIC